jgi:hypothetical protein
LITGVARRLLNTIGFDNTEEVPDVLGDNIHNGETVTPTIYNNCQNNLHTAIFKTVL